KRADHSSRRNAAIYYVPITPQTRNLFLHEYLELELEAEVDTAAGVVIGERQIRPLQVGVLRLVRHVLNRRHDTEVSVDVVADLRIELAVCGFEDLIGVVLASLVGEREGGAHQ